MNIDEQAIRNGVSAWETVRFVTPDVAIASVRWKKGSFVAPNGVTYPEAEDMMSMIWVRRQSIFIS
jgi:hypothetical protein